MNKVQRAEIQLDLYKMTDSLTDRDMKSKLDDIEVTIDKLLGVTAVTWKNSHSRQDSGWGTGIANVHLNSFV